MVLGLVNTVGDWLVIEDVTTGLADTTTMTASVAVDLRKIRFADRVRMTLRYASLNVLLNGVPIVTPRVQSLSLEGGKLKLDTLLAFAAGADTVKELGAVIDQSGDILFGNKGKKDRPLSATVRGIRIGSSADSIVELAGKIDVTLDALPYLDKARTWYNANWPFTIDNIQSTLTKRGIDVDVDISNRLPIPLTANFPSVSARIFYRGEGDTVLVNCWVNDLVVAKGKVKFHLWIDPVFPDVMKGLNDAVPLLLAYKDLAQNAYLGGFQLHTIGEPSKATPAQTFNVFYGARMDPPELFFYRPLVIRPILVNPFKDGLGLDLEVGFTNPGPVHINIGDVYFGLARGDTRLGGITIDNFVLKNQHEGGGKNLARAKARVTLNLLDVPGILIDLVAHRDKFGYKSDIRWQKDEELVWLNRIAERLPPAILGRLWEVLFGLLRNASVRLFKEDGVKLAAASGAPANGTLSRRWLGKRAALDEKVAKIEVAKWTADPVVPAELADFITVDWSALTVIEA
ncbi:hypothetical protein H9P43_001668 [Blastocladiella emersonii ATCC 22665]|nr:hypothetical protein H9P43_001668 [Blastocladiella emersonii ATCC 22665]